MFGPTRLLCLARLTCCGSLQALLIPPSHNAVIYSLAAGGTVSIGHLFLAGEVAALALLLQARVEIARSNGSRRRPSCRA